MKATHTQMATFRAVENGVTLVRPTRQGISLAVDPQGRVLAAADYYAADRTAIVAAVPTRGVATLYARIGDSFAYLCLAGLGILTLLALFHRRPAALAWLASPPRRSHPPAAPSPDGCPGRSNRDRSAATDGCSAIAGLTGQAGAPTASRAAVLILIYVVWVLAYDVPWSYALWRLNPDPQQS